MYITEANLSRYFLVLKFFTHRSSIFFLTNVWSKRAYSSRFLSILNNEKCVLIFISLSLCFHEIWRDQCRSFLTWQDNPCTVQSMDNQVHRRCEKQPYDREEVLLSKERKWNQYNESILWIETTNISHGQQTEEQSPDVISKVFEWVLLNFWFFLRVV